MFLKGKFEKQKGYIMVFLNVFKYFQKEKFEKQKGDIMVIQM